jgi:hypothetical protein
MQLCPNCAAEIIPGAKFCHRCGDKIKEKTKNCPACNEHSPLASVFCHHCGFHFEGKERSGKLYTPVYALNFDGGDVTEQVKALFFRNLRKRVEDEHDITRYSDYVERFYQSRFREIYGARSEQIARDVEKQWERFGKEGLPEIDRFLDESFDGLLDYFTIQYCPDLNGIILPSAILKHEKAAPGKTDQWTMIRDFLDFEREEEVFYFNFFSMPEHLLVNACKNYLTADRKEKVFFICDLSLKGNCKEGFAMTDRGIYWRAPFDKPRIVLYSDMKDIRKEKDWLTINGHFFTANPALNLKLCKLLKKLKGWHPVPAPTETISVP